jgi:peptidoglycan biosynthesis protein MviN/MurJ (putative lipid II flippase)
MAKKDGGMKSHTLLKAWGAVAFVGLFTYLATYNENFKPISVRKKPWQITLIAVVIAVAVMGALVGLYFLLRHFFFPELQIANKWVFLIYAIVVFVIGSVVSVIETVQSRKEKHE